MAPPCGCSTMASTTAFQAVYDGSIPFTRSRLRPYIPRMDIYRGIEQLAARRAHNPKVPGSSPGPATR